MKSCRVSDYSGRSLSASGDIGDIFLDPGHPRAKKVTQWSSKCPSTDILRKDIRSLTTVSSSNRLWLIEELVSHAENDPEIQSGKPLYAKVNCELTWIYIPLDPLDKPMFYLACQVCRRKLVTENNNYVCATCDKNFQEAMPTYNFQVILTDCSGSIRAQCFGEVG